MQRLPGLPSSNLGLEILMGKDETIEFEDFLNGFCLFIHSFIFFFVHPIIKYKTETKILFFAINK